MPVLWVLIGPPKMQMLLPPGNVGGMSLANSGIPAWANAQDIERLRGETQLLTQALFSFKKLFAESAQASNEATKTMVRLTRVLAALTAAILALTVLLVIDAVL